MTQSRLTINLQCQYVRDWGATLDFLRKLQPVAVIACIDNMDARNRVYEVQQALPNALTIGRFIYSNDGGMHTKPQTNNDEYVVSPVNALNVWGELGKDGRMLYLMNEPMLNGANDENMARLSRWLVESIQIASERGIRLLVGNFGVGHPALSGYGEYDQRLDDVLRAISAHRDTVALGIHLYAPADTYTRIDGLIKRCKTLGIDVPHVHIGEFGFDAGSGGDPLSGYKSRGISGAQFATWCVDKVKNVYNQYITDDIVQSVAVFCWGNEASWKPFNVETDADWQATILDAASKGLLSVPSKPTTKPFITPVPMPTDAAGSIRIRVKNVQINVRSGNGTEYQDAGDLKAGQEVTLYRFPVKRDTQGLNWQWVDITDKLGGWVCTSVLQFERVEPPVIVDVPPVSDPVTPSVPYPEIRATYAREMAKVYRSLATSYHAMATDSEATAAQWEKLANIIEDKAA